MGASRLGPLLPLLFGSTPAWAVDGFQDARWGMSPDEVRAVAPENACKPKLKTIQGLDELSCKQPAGGLEATEVSYFFRDDKLEQVTVWALINDNKGVHAGQAIMDALIGKYGPPDAGVPAHSACIAGGAGDARVQWSAQGVDAIAFDAGPTTAVHLCYIDLGVADASARAAQDAAKAAAEKAASGL